MFVAYRGYSATLFAPIAARGPVLLSDPGVVPAAFTNQFMVKMDAFAQLCFPVFRLGAVFGKVNELSGFSKAIVAAIIGFESGQNRRQEPAPAKAGIIGRARYTIFQMADVGFSEATNKAALAPKLGGGAIHLGGHRSGDRRENISS